VGRWRLGCAILVLAASGSGCRRLSGDGPRRARGGEAARTEPAAGSDAAALLALGYTDGDQPAGEHAGVTTWDRAQVPDGTNLIVSAHGWSVELVDMEARPVHTWRVPPEAQVGQRRPQVRRAWVLDGGDLLFVVEGSSMVRLDRDGAMRWRVDDNNHHDVHVDVDGSLWGLTRRASTIARIDPDHPVLIDEITHYAADGVRLGSWSIPQAILDTPRAQELVRAMRAGNRDITHTNSLVRLDGRAQAKNPAFAEGRFLISMRNLSALAVVDPERRQLAWWSADGTHDRQHDASVTADANLLLLDNDPPGPSEVEVRDVATMEVLRSWRAQGEGSEAFFTACCGTVQPTPGGHLLVVLTGPGHAMEVTASGEVVWEYWSPHRAPGKPDTVASLFDVVRGPPREALTWLR
jgi:hypothetical protein